MGWYALCDVLPETYRITWMSNVGALKKSKIINIFSMECVKAVSSETPCCQSNKNSRFILCGYIVMAITLTVSMVAGAVWGLDRGEDWDASTRMITARELLSFDGKDGRPAYFSYRGKVYDVTQSPFWKDGKHPGGITAGQTLTTEQMERAPHGEEVLDVFKVVGVLEGSDVLSQNGTVETTVPGLIRIFGKTLTAWSGYLLGIVFLLNFFTCCVMPWRSHTLPFKGKRPGTDAWDSQGFLRLTAIHAPIAWATIILGTLHGVLGILQSFGIYL